MNQLGEERGRRKEEVMNLSMFGEKNQVTHKFLVTFDS
jgi:hypothetical protein